MTLIDRAMKFFGLYVPPIPTPEEYKRTAALDKAEYMVAFWARACLYVTPDQPHHPMWRSLCVENIEKWQREASTQRSLLEA